MSGCRTQRGMSVICSPGDVVSGSFAAADDGVYLEEAITTLVGWDRTRDPVRTELMDVVADVCVDEAFLIIRKIESGVVLEAAGCALVVRKV